VSVPTTPSLETTSVGQSFSSADLSVWSLFIHADWVVQFVMIILLMASLWCWTIIFAKLMKLRDLQASAERFEEAFWGGGSLDSLYDRVGSRPNDPLSAIFAAAMREWRRTTTRGKNAARELRETLHHRIDRVMNVTLNREMEQLERNTNFLASVGSTAPFIGLFGTVWGIMHSFQGIAQMQSTNLAVVAPGIAEALFATAIGLVAAIPAVLAYNKISTELARYANRLESFASEFSAIISRQLEEIE
jgi:biopolymer transport protein TolQ